MRGKSPSKNGQAMVEMLLGLVAIMVLLLGIDLIANIVYYDFTTIYSAREEVADSLIAESAGTSGGSSSYDFDAVRGDFMDAVNPSGGLLSQLKLFPGDRENQFDFMWDGSNPLEDLVGAEKGSSTPVTSPLMRKIVGRSSLSINNAVYMPPWEDLMGSGSSSE